MHLLAPELLNRYREIYPAPEMAVMREKEKDLEIKAIYPKNKVMSSQRLMLRERERYSHQKSNRG